MSASAVVVGSAISNPVTAAAAAGIVLVALAVAWVVLDSEEVEISSKAGSFKTKRRK